MLRHQQKTITNNLHQQLQWWLLLSPSEKGRNVVSFFIWRSYEMRRCRFSIFWWFNDTRHRPLLTQTTKYEIVNDCDNGDPNKTHLNTSGLLSQNKELLNWQLEPNYGVKNKPYPNMKANILIQLCKHKKFKIHCSCLFRFVSYSFPFGLVIVILIII